MLIHPAAGPSCAIGGHEERRFAQGDLFVSIGQRRPARHAQAGATRVRRDDAGIGFGFGQTCASFNRKHKKSTFLINIQFLQFPNKIIV